MHADDTQLLNADLPSNMPALKACIESTLSIVLQWFTQNRLKINPTVATFIAEDLK